MKKKDQSLAAAFRAASDSAVRRDSKIRTLDELAAAIVYLEIMERHSAKDPDQENGRLVGKVAAKGQQMIRWAAGENKFPRRALRQGRSQANSRS
jgi:hypothetical protein